MHSVTLQSQTDFGGWRAAARSLLAADIAPDRVSWRVSGQSASLFDEPDSHVAAATGPKFNVPREFLELASSVALHRDPGRFALLYRLLWRLRDEPRLLSLTMDPDVVQTHAWAKAIGRDIHKMHAYVRFREVPGTDPQGYVAWFEPDHHIVEAATPFFVRRFTNFPWAILTPERSAHWDLRDLAFGPGAKRSDAPTDDATEDLWRRYYASIFNPARLKVSAMLGHMPKKYWRNLPESELIPQLIAQSQERTLDMISRSATTAQHKRRAVAAPSLAKRRAPETSLDAVREDAAHCRDCPLWKNATQTVFGEGRKSAKIVFVGEQPGDQEDLAGRPFVGPAGKLLNRALEDAGIDRTATYVTNAVKHFKFEPRGKRRIHKKPSDLEITACHQWIERELHVIQPELIVALGATAARSIFGRATPIEKNRGRVIKAANAESDHESDILVTHEPSSISEQQRRCRHFFDVVPHQENCHATRRQIEIHGQAET
jgi:probable DNA metabolism protein